MKNTFYLKKIMLVLGILVVSASQVVPIHATSQKIAPFNALRNQSLLPSTGVGASNTLLYGVLLILVGAVFLVILKKKRK